MAEKSAGRRLSVRERRELKVGLLESLLPRVLPAVKLVDVLFLPEQRRILSFGTSKPFREELQKLVFRTFAVQLVPLDAETLARRVGLDRAALARLDEVSPVPWPRAERRGRPVLVEPELELAEHEGAV
jgi:hypothetical protein